MADSVYWRSLVAVARKLTELDLEGFNDRVLIVKQPGDAGYRISDGAVVDALYPCLQVSIEGATEEKVAGDTERWEQSCPAFCWITDKEHQNRHDRLRVYLNARDTILRAFDDQGSLPGVPEVYQTTAEPNVVIDPRLPWYQHVVSGILIRAFAAAPRE